MRQNQEESAKQLFQFRKPGTEEKYSYVYRVAFADTDAMQIMHHASYVKIIERARVGYLDETHYRYAYWCKKNIHLPVIDLKIHYRMSFVFDDYILTKVNLLLEGVRVIVQYKLWPVPPAQKRGLLEGNHYHLEPPQDSPWATAETVHVAMGPNGDAKRMSHVLKLFLADEKSS